MSPLRLWAVVLVVALAGCRREDCSRADGKILWDTQGCAYVVHAGMGDTSFVIPVPDANRTSCPLTPEPEK